MKTIRTYEQEDLLQMVHDIEAAKGYEIINWKFITRESGTADDTGLHEIKRVDLEVLCRELKAKPMSPKAPEVLKVETQEEQQVVRLDEGLGESLEPLIPDIAATRTAGASMESLMAASKSLIREKEQASGRGLRNTKGKTNA